MIEERGIYRDFEYVAVLRTDVGARYGYVIFDEKEEGIINYLKETSRVHGGITWAGTGIYEIKEFCIGFDCMHAGDLIKRYFEILGHIPNKEIIERTKEYVVENCRILIDEIHYILLHPELLI